jgi:putative ABC transport system substrate-binding protein
MNRRGLLEAGAAVLASPALLFAQAPKRFRVGWLLAGSPESLNPLEEALLTGLRERGYLPGRNLVLDVRFARGDTARLPALAGELVALKPDVLLAIEPEAGVLRAKTDKIPIVLTASSDPVAAGLVKSLARPGTNVTGMAYRNEELLAKHIELLTEINPKMSRLALFNKVPLPNSYDVDLTARFEEVAKRAAAAKGLNLVVARARNPQEVGQAFAELEKGRPDALVVVATGATFALRQEILAHARRLRLPSISSLPPAWVEAGGLLNYGPNFLETYRYVATFVDRILKGANPAEMPVEQPAKFELVVNLKAAREIGVTIPSSILLRADRVIE